MSRTGIQLLVGFADVLGDDFSSDTTGDGASDGTTVVDTTLQQYGDNYLDGWWIYLESDGSERRISSFAGSTATVAPAFSAQVSSGAAYRLHRYQPSKMFAALDSARFQVYPDLYRIVHDEMSLRHSGNSFITGTPCQSSTMHGYRQ